MSVYCESSYLEWGQIEQTIGNIDVEGFTWAPPTPAPAPFATGWIYLSPPICESLHAILDDGFDAVGPFWGSLAVKTVVHESIHQRGVTDESVTDCTALQELDTYLPAFGVPATATTTVLKRKTTRKRIKVAAGKYRTITITSMVPTNVTIPNPEIATINQWAAAWHKALPAAYQGAC